MTFTEWVCGSHKPGCECDGCRWLARQDPALEPVRKALRYVQLAAEQILVASMRLENIDDPEPEDVTLLPADYDERVALWNRLQEVREEVEDLRAQYRERFGSRAASRLTVPAER